MVKVEVGWESELLSFPARVIYLTRENLAGSDHVIIPYKVVNSGFVILYGLIKVLLSAYFSSASINSYVPEQNHQVYWWEN